MWVGGGRGGEQGKGTWPPSLVMVLEQTGPFGQLPRHRNGQAGDCLIKICLAPGQTVNKRSGKTRAGSGGRFMRWLLADPLSESHRRRLIHWLSLKSEREAFILPLPPPTPKGLWQRGGVRNTVRQVIKTRFGPDVYLFFGWRALGWAREWFLVGFAPSPPFFLLCNQ